MESWGKPDFKYTHHNLYHRAKDGIEGISVTVDGDHHQDPSRLSPTCSGLVGLLCSLLTI